MDLYTARKLWYLLPHPSDSHVVRLFARNRGGKVTGDFARSPEEIVRFANSLPDWNCYVCPNPTLRTDGVRHNAEDVTHWSFFLVDIDPIEDEFNAEEALCEVMTKLGGFFGHDLFSRKWMPTIIYSGRGYQIWFRGDDLEFSDSFTRNHARKVMSYWLTFFSKRFGMIYGCKIDTSTSDLPRPMRLVGTYNIKTGEEAHFKEIQEKPFPWLFPILWGATPKEVLIEKEIVVTSGKRWQDVFRYLTPSAQEYLLKGLVEPGRHKRVSHVAKSLLELGISREETRNAIVRANKLQGEDQELPLEAIEHALDTAGFPRVEKVVDTAG